MSAVFSLMRGGPSSSLETRAFHFNLPAVSYARTSPLSVPTAATSPSAPTPATSFVPVLTRQFRRPVAASKLASEPSGVAAYTALPLGAGENPVADGALSGCCQPICPAAVDLYSGSGAGGFSSLPNQEQPASATPHPAMMASGRTRSNIGLR